MNFSEPDVQRLAEIADKIKGEYIQEGKAWANSPFAWIRACPSRQIGKIGERLVAGWCAGRGLQVIGCRDPEADLLIEGHRVEVKFSTLWESGIYVFQQIRNQNYEYVICLGLSPFDAHCWVIPRGGAEKGLAPAYWPGWRRDVLASCESGFASAVAVRVRGFPGKSLGGTSEGCGWLLRKR